MKINEFLMETSNEDRAIVSLSSAISKFLRKYSNEELDDIKVGKIGDIFDTPLEILNPVNLIILSNEKFSKYLNIQDNEEVPGGFWNPESETIIINKDLLPENTLAGMISHEIRHALDDYKSDFRANKSTRYTTRKSKSVKNSDSSEDDYLAQPAEINARFLEVLNSLTPIIQTSIEKQGKEKAAPYIQHEFFRALQHFQLAELFPEKEQSRKYKRLIKRGMDYINKEIEHQSKNSNN